VGSVDDVTVVFTVKLRLSPELTTKKLGWVCGGKVNGQGVKTRSTVRVLKQGDTVKAVASIHMKIYIF